MSKVVLDAFPLLAPRRARREKVADVIGTSRMLSVNYAEVVSHFIQAGLPADQVNAMLRPLPMAIVEANHGLATSTGRLRAGMVFRRSRRQRGIRPQRQAQKRAHCS